MPLLTRTATIIDFEGNSNMEMRSAVVRRLAGAGDVMASRRITMIRTSTPTPLQLTEPGGVLGGPIQQPRHRGGQARRFRGEGRGHGRPIHLRAGLQAGQ